MYKAKRFTALCMNRCDDAGRGNVIFGLAGPATIDKKTLSRTFRTATEWEIRKLVFAIIVVTAH
jgi:hypothetical protein